MWSSLDMLNFLLNDPLKWDCLAKKVICVSRRHPILKNSPELLPFEVQGKLEIISSEVAKVDENKVSLNNGASFDIDGIIYATGYQRSYPFLPIELVEEEEPGYIGPIYKHIWSINNPNLMFLGKFYTIPNIFTREA